MRDITLLIAHPDDEALFLWPFLGRVKRIVCASDDSLNPERAWCRERGLCLREVGQLLGCEIVCHSNDSEFYRVPARNGALKLIADDLIAAIGNPDILATHNSWGEYGHVDHLLCHHIGRTVQARTGCPLLVTDIAVTEHPAWLPITPCRQGNWYSKQLHDVSDLNRQLFDCIKAIYDARGCWTWAWEPVERCSVYSL